MTSPMRITIPEAIAALRYEIEEAQRQAHGKQLQFAIEDVELELQLTVSETKGTTGKVGTEWKVAKKVSVPFFGGIEGEGKVAGERLSSDAHEREVTHTLRLRLKPQQQGQTGPTMITDQVAELPNVADD